MKSRIAVLLLAVGVSQILIFLGHWALYQTIALAYTLDNAPVRVSVRSVLVFLSVIFMIAQILISRWRSRFLNIIYIAAAVWLGTVHTLLLACAVFWIVAAISFAAGFALPWMAFGSALFGVALLASVYGIYHSFDTKVTRYEIRLAGLPQVWRGRKAVMVSDSHFGSVRGVGSSEKLVRMVNAENPDIVFIPGDFFDGPPADYAALTAPLAKLHPRFGTYFSEGNHEEFTNPAPYLDALRAAGVKILDKECVEIEGLQVLGISYADSYRGRELRESLRKTPFDRNRPSVFLKHAPSARRTAAEAGISLMLCGHTHKGQLWPFSLFAWHLFGKAVYGWSEKDGMQVITSSGFGTWGPPQRLGTKAEIVAITFA